VVSNTFKEVGMFALDHKKKVGSFSSYIRPPGNQLNQLSSFVDPDLVDP
jgi:hypothetical protein